MKRAIFIFVVALLGLGCEGVDTKEQADFQELNNGSKVNLNTDRPYCEVDLVDYELDAHILAFELVDRGGLAVGFDIISNFFKAINLGFKIERARMMASMHMSESLRPNETIVDVYGRGKSSKTEFKVGIDMGQLGMDMDYYRQTPLHKLTERTMKDTLNNMRKEMDQVQAKWRTKATHVYNDLGELLIPAGSVAGIRVGDRFSVYNVDYIWEGEPCNSKLVFERKTTRDPLAILQVIDVDEHASQLAMIESSSDEPIQVGAIVEINNLPRTKKEKTRVLSRSVRIRSMRSEKLQIPEAKDVDVSLYVREQTQALLSEYKLYPRK